MHSKLLTALSFLLLLSLGLPCASAQDRQQTEHVIHITKWFERLDDIAAQYGVSVDAIMSANGLKTSKLKPRQKLIIPSGAVDSSDGKQEESPEGAVSAGENDGWSLFPFLFRKEKVNVALMLPFNSGSEQAAASNMDFYSGVLVAVKQLAAEEIPVDLQVIDVSDSLHAYPAENTDLVIGPLSPWDLADVLSIVPGSTAVISPLDPKAASMVEGHPNFIQAPTPHERQGDDLVAWLSEDFNPASDRIIVISNSAEGNASLGRSIASSGLPHRSFSYNILDGRDVIDSLTEILSPEGTNRVVINSENEAFCGDVVRNLSLLMHGKMDIVAYGSSKIRNFSTIDVENLHSLTLHCCASYYIDYDAPETADFLLAYRALFKTEPNRFAFQGYDLCRFFARKAFRERRWLSRLPESGRGRMLQADFLFSNTDEFNGLSNTAVRRIVMEQNFTTTLR